jgi:hypothetical protein
LLILTIRFKYTNIIDPLTVPLYYYSTVSTIRPKRDRQVVGLTKMPDNMETGGGGVGGGGGRDKSQFYWKSSISMKSGLLTIILQ